MEKSNEIEEILNIIQFKTGKTLEEIAEDIGYSRPYLNNVKLQGNAPSKILGRLKDKYSEILQKVPRETNLSEPEPDYLKQRRDHKNGTNEKAIPMYFGNTRAGTIQVYSDDPEMQVPVGHLPASIFPGCNHAEKISGDSMYPLICNQAFLIGKIIDKRGLIWGEKYIIHTQYGQSMVKYVHPSEKEKHIKIVSHNKTIPPQDLPMDDITFVCRVHYIVNPS